MHRRFLAGGGQPAGGELADGLQQRVTDRGAVLEAHDGLAGQAGQQPGDRLRLQRPARGHPFGRAEVEPAAQHRQAAQQAAFGLIEQLIAPRDQRLQRPVPPRAGRTAGQQPGMAIQPGSQLSRAQSRAPGRGQLDGQRNAVQPGTHLRNRGRVVRRQLEGRAGRTGPGREQQAGLGSGDRRRRAVGRQPQRRHREDQLTGNIQAFPAGGQEPHPAAPGKQRGHQGRRSRQDVLAVVQHHQQLTADQLAHQPRGRGGRIPLRHPQRLRDASRDQRRIGERGQLDQPGAIAKAGLGQHRHPQRQPGLAAPARASQRNHPGSAEPLTHGSYLRAAAHQRAHLGRQPRLPLRKTCRLRTPLNRRG